MPIAKVSFRLVHHVTLEVPLPDGTVRNVQVAAGDIRGSALGPGVKIEHIFPPEALKKPAPEMVSISDEFIARVVEQIAASETPQAS